MKLVLFDAKWDDRCLDPTVLAAQACCRFAGYSLLEDNVRYPAIAAFGQLPVLKLECGDIIPKSEILAKLRETTSIDSDLGPQQQAEACAFVSLVDSKIRGALTYELWRQPDNYRLVSRRLYWSTIPFPISVYHLCQALWTQRVCGSVIERAEAVSLLREALQALSDRLGQADFFFGNSPRSLDAIVYGYLAVIFYTTLPEPNCKPMLTQFQALVAFTERITQRYFSSNVTPSLRLVPEAVPSSSPDARREEAQVPTNLQIPTRRLPKTPREIAQRRRTQLSIAVAVVSTLAYMYWGNSPIKFVFTDSATDGDT
eukprot:GILK01006692.1.p1 GENE.GILK01006692.1~~GILK01006692.1.p1  ORF type:complete len:314 (-),score=22.73 GILK01006692.1:232-1173(-)